MSEPIPQSVTCRVKLKVFLSADESEATGKTVTVTISKNGGAFGNPSAGVTTASEIGNGWYYVDLSTTDTNTLGPLIVRGTATGCDNSEVLLRVVGTYNGGWAALPNVAAEATGGLFTRGTGAGQINQTANGLIDANATRINNVTNAASNLQSLMEAFPIYTIDTSVTTPTTTKFEITTPNNQDKFTGQRFRVVGGAAYHGLEANVLSVEFRTSTKCIITCEALPAALTNSEFVQFTGRASSTTWDEFRIYKVAASSTATGIKTNCTEATGFWEPGQTLSIITGSQRSATRVITAYSNTDGEFTVDPAFDSAPAANELVAVGGFITQ